MVLARGCKVCLYTIKNHVYRFLHVLELQPNPPLILNNSDSAGLSGRRNSCTPGGLLQVKLIGEESVNEEVSGLRKATL